MATALVILGSLTAWLVTSIIFFLRTMGQKGRRPRWWDYPLLAPVMLIAVVFGWMRF